MLSEKINKIKEECNKCDSYTFWKLRELNKMKEELPKNKSIGYLYFMDDIQPHITEMKRQLFEIEKEIKSQDELIKEMYKIIKYIPTRYAICEALEEDIKEILQKAKKYIEEQ